MLNNYFNVTFLDISIRLSHAVPETSFFLFGYADKMKRGLVERRKSINWFSSNLASKACHDVGAEPNARYGLTGKPETLLG